MDELIMKRAPMLVQYLQEHAQENEKVRMLLPNVDGLANENITVNSALRLDLTSDKSKNREDENRKLKLFRLLPYRLSKLVVKLKKLLSLEWLKSRSCVMLISNQISR